MALNPARLGSAIATTLAAIPAPLKANDVTVWTAIASQIILEIQNHGTIVIGTLASTGADPQGGVVNSVNTSTGQIQ